MKKGAIFDMDGLLFDTEKLYQMSWLEVAKQFGQIAHPEFPIAICGSSGTYLLEIIHRYYPDVDAEQFRDAGMQMVRDHLQMEVPEKQGVREILQYFQEAGFCIALASSSERSMILHNLEKSGLTDYFDAIVSGQDIEHGKPAPDIFLKAAALIGCEPQNCYVFEDGFNGVRAGAAAGCKTIMIPDILLPTPETKNLCVGICDSLQDALQCIQKNIL